MKYKYTKPSFKVGKPTVKHHYTLVFICAIVAVFYLALAFYSPRVIPTFGPIPEAQALISDGANALNVIGQFNVTSSAITYTKVGESNGPNNRGFNGPYDVEVDTVNNRMFVSDRSNNRVLVYNLNSSNELVDYTADNVLGQPNFDSNTAGTTDSLLNEPWGLAYDSTNDRLFVASYKSSRVLVYDTASITDGEAAVNVLGQPNFTTASVGTAINKLSLPTALEYDSVSNTLYVAEIGNDRVVTYDVASITDGEDAQNVLGQADFVSSGADTTSTTFNNPYDLAYDDSTQKLYVADYSNVRVLIFDVLTITNGEAAENVLGQTDFTSNTGATTQSGLRGPLGLVVVSSTSKLFISDALTGRRILVHDISSISDGQNASNVLGATGFTASSNQSTQANVSGPGGLAYDKGRNAVWVTDISLHRILEFTVDSITDGENATNIVGHVDTNGDPYYLSGNANGGANKIGFSGPAGIDLDTTNNRLFVVDRNYNRLLVFNTDSFNHVVDYTADNILGKTDFHDPSALDANNRMWLPWDVLYDSNDERLFVADNNNRQILIYDTGDGITDGESPSSILADGGLGPTQAKMSNPSGLAYDAVNKRLFVSDNTDDRVLVFDASDGLDDNENAVNVIGQDDFTTNKSDTVDSSTFNYVTDVAYDSNNNRLFVADYNNERVLEFDVSTITDGEAATKVLGQPDFTSSGNATTQSGMKNPWGLEYDTTANRLFVSDYTNDRVLIYNVSSTVNGQNAAHVLGQSNFTSGTGSATQSGLNGPRSLRYNEANGRLYVPDSFYNRVMVFDATPATTTPVAPTTLTTSSLATTSFTLGYTDNTSSTEQEAFFEIKYSTSSDVTGFDTLVGQPTVDTATQSVTGLDVNAAYWFQANSINIAGSASSTALYVVTLANAPGTPTTANVTTSTIDLTLDDNSNPATTTYAFCTSSNGTSCDSSGYVQTDGTLGSTAAWQATSTWGSNFTVTGLSLNTQHYFLSTARNGDNIETALSSASTAATTLAKAPGTATLAAATQTTIDVTLDDNSNPATTTYSFCTSSNGTSCDSSGYVQTDGTLGSTAAWQATSTWGADFTVTGLAADTSYQFISKARNGDFIETAFSSAASLSTSAAPSTDTPGPGGFRLFKQQEAEKIADAIAAEEALAEEENSSNEDSSLIVEEVVEETETEDTNEEASEEENTPTEDKSQETTKVKLISHILTKTNSSPSNSNSGGSINPNTKPSTTEPTIVEQPTPELIEEPTPTLIVEETKREEKPKEKVEVPEPVKKAISEPVLNLAKSVSTFVNKSVGVLVETIIEKFSGFFSRLFR